MIRKLASTLALGSLLIGTAFARAPISVNSYMTATAGVKQLDAYDNTVATTLGADLAYKLSENKSLTASLSLTKDLKNDYKEELDNGKIGYSQKKIVKFNKYMNLNGSASAMIPMNRDTTQIKRMYTKVTVTPSLVTDLKAIHLKYVTLTLSSSVGKGFYKYYQSEEGGANANYSVSNRVGLSYAPIEQISLDASFANTHTWDYYNNRRPDKFEMDQSISYSPTAKFSVTVGHNIGGNTFKYDGAESYIRFFDKNRSSVYSTLSYLF